MSMLLEPCPGPVGIAAGARGEARRRPRPAGRFSPLIPGMEGTVSWGRDAAVRPAHGAT